MHWISDLFFAFIPDTPGGWLAVGCVVLVWRYGLGLLTDARAQASSDKKQLEAIRAASEQDFDRFNGAAPAIATTRDELFGRLGVTDQRSLIAQRIDALWRLRFAGRDGAVAVLDAQGQLEEGHNDVPRFLASVLVLIGLAGTILSLHGVIGNLGGAISIQSNGLSDRVQQALRPMSSAFSATLWGIISSILLGQKLTEVDRSKREYLANLEQTMTVSVMPLIFLSEQAQIGQMSETIMQGRKNLAEFIIAIRDSRDFFATTLGGAVREAAIELQSGLNSATKSLNTSLAQMQASATTLNETVKSVVQYREELAVERQELQSFIRESGAHLRAMAEGVMRPLENASQSLNKGSSSMNTLAGAVAEIGKRFNEERASLQEMLIASDRKSIEAYAGILGQIQAFRQESADQNKNERESFLEQANRDRKTFLIAVDAQLKNDSNQREIIRSDEEVRRDNQRELYQTYLADLINKLQMREETFVKSFRVERTALQNEQRQERELLQKQSEMSLIAFQAQVQTDLKNLLADHRAELAKTIEVLASESSRNSMRDAVERADSFRRWELLFDKLNNSAPMTQLPNLVSSQGSPTAMADQNFLRYAQSPSASKSPKGVDKTTPSSKELLIAHNANGKKTNAAKIAEDGNPLTKGHLVAEISES